MLVFCSYVLMYVPPLPPSATDCTICVYVHSVPNDLSMRATSTGSNDCLPLRGFNHNLCMCPVVEG